MFFDSHAHINDPVLLDKREEIFSAMRREQVSGLMNVGCCEESSRDCVALAEKYPFIYAAIGSHPDDAASVTPELIDRYRALAEHPKVKAIGEIGLDYHYESVPREVQQQAFRMQLALAGDLGLPVIVHEREAHDDGLRIVREFPELKGVFHCFSGSWEFAKVLLKEGWYLGFTGVLTFKNARKAVEVAARAPLDRILIETDCPFMAPEPFRGRPSNPSQVPLVAAKLAEIRGISVEEAAAATRENALRLFRI